jgi:hypothetical protein
MREISLYVIATFLIVTTARAAVKLKRQVEDRRLNSIACKTIDKIEELLGTSGGNLVYAGYPYDPFVVDTVKR